MRVRRYTSQSRGRFVWPSPSAWVRQSWFIVTLFGMLMFALALPELWRTLTSVCTAESCKPGQRTSTGLAALSQLGLSPQVYSVFMLTAYVMVPVVISGVMGFVVWRKPHDKVVACLAFAGVTCSLIGTLTDMAGRHPWMVLPLHGFWLISGVGFALGLLSFPDGRFIPSWSRYLAFTLAASSAFVFVPGMSRLGGMGETLAVVGFGLTFPIGLVVQLIRFTHTDDVEQRQQVKWVVFSIGVMVFVLVANIVLNVLMPEVLMAAGSPGSMVTTFLGTSSIIFFWLCIAVSVYRYRLFDVDLIIKRALIYGGLTLGVLLIYLVAITAAGVLTLSSNNLGVSLLATGTVALAFHPLRERLQRGVNRLLYGYRDEPYTAMTELSRRLEVTLEPTAVLPTTVATVAQTLKVPFVEIALKQEAGFQSVARFGEKGSAVETFPLVYAGVTLGELRVSPRASENRLSGADTYLLADLVRQVGVAAHALLLQADLERSRLRIVTAREEARRQLGNDLHDTVGHQLAALTRRAETASNMLAHRPEEARQLLGEMVNQGRAAADHVRALAHQLHPPELEVLGLVGVIREWAEAEGGSLQIHLELPEHLPKLPAAVEVAAYCIVREALYNVHKYARARHCTVRLAHVRNAPLATSVLTALDTPVLDIDVTDDGLGFRSPDTVGLGLTSMRERAAEVGGTCRVEALAGHGTRVAVRLPCPEVL
jgi:signal transduction histidine kinase